MIDLRHEPHNLIEKHRHGTGLFDLRPSAAASAGNRQSGGVQRVESIRHGAALLPSPLRGNGAPDRLDGPSDVPELGLDAPAVRGSAGLGSRSLPLDEPALSPLSRGGGHRHAGATDSPPTLAGSTALSSHDRSPLPDPRRVPRRRPP